MNLILYQDAFEVANPFGSAKCVHEVVGVFYILGNLYPEFRSQIDGIQLALLIKDKHVKHFGHEMVYSRLIADLKRFEQGLDVDGEHCVPVRVRFILGDYIGSHSIGGFIENLSATE